MDKLKKELPFVEARNQGDLGWSLPIDLSEPGQVKIIANYGDIFGKHHEWIKEQVRLEFARNDKFKGENGAVEML